MKTKFKKLSVCTMQKKYTMSPITQDQIDILDSLVVERLSDNVDNVALV